MSRFPLIAAAVATFVGAALLGSHTGSASIGRSSSTKSIGRSPRRQEVAGGTQRDLPAELAKFEHAIFVRKTLQSGLHDAKGMEELLATERRVIRAMSGVVCCGGGGISESSSYAVEWAEESPQDMLAWLLQGGDSSYTATLFASWAMHDMAAALAAVSQLPKGKLRQQALASTLQKLCPADPGRARDLLIQNLDLFPPNECSPFSLSFGGKDAGICDLLLSLPPGAERTHLVADFLKKMAYLTVDEMAQKAMAVWRDASMEWRNELVASGFDVREGSSFEGLEQMVRERAESSGDPAMAKTFLQSNGLEWAKRDLSGALAWTQVHAKGQFRVDESVRYFEEVTDQDFDKAMAAWQTLPDGILKARAAGAISRRAPSGRKAEAEAAKMTLSNYDQTLAR